MISMSCRAFRVRIDKDGRMLLEVENEAPADLLPRLIKQKDAAKRLAVSINHLVKLAKKHGIRPVAEKPARYIEADLIKLTLPAGEPLAVVPAIVPMPTAQTKTVVVLPSPAATTPATLSARKTKLHL